MIDAETDEGLRQAYTEMLDGCLCNPEQRLFYAIWLISLKGAPDTVVGDFCFKGRGATGAVEIGYGLRNGFCGNGYMTEAVCAATAWALGQPGVTRVEAETEPDNLASQMVLYRAGFRPTGETGKEGPRFAFRQDGESEDIHIQKITKENFRIGSLAAFDRFQRVTRVYRLRDGVPTLADDPFTETWTEARKREKEKEILHGNFVSYGAFIGDRIVGEIMLVPTPDDGRLVIDSFHVSLPYRRRGIGRMLLDAAVEEAKMRGAHALYASACSAEETVRFYTAMGFSLSPHPISAYAEDEPFDLQMEKPL